jgi:acyl-CoA synthetase (AMP-forming)/AMP-acid ligase II
MDLWSMLERAERLYPRAEGCVDGARRLDYASVAARARALAACLKNRGVARGERVAILDHNSLEFLETYFAAAGLGAVLCPLNVRLAAPELAEILRDCGARVLVARAELAQLARAAIALDTPLELVIWIGGGPRLDDLRTLEYELALDSDGRSFERTAAGEHAIAQLYYTSGTTGRPKGVILTHKNVATHALAAIAELALSDRDVWIHAAPMFHLADAWAVFAITWIGARHVFLPRFDEAEFLDQVERERVTITNLIPTMLQRVVRHPGVDARDFSSFRLILSGGAPIAPEVVRRVMAVFRCEYVQTYGLTETSPYLTLSLLERHLRELPPEDRFRYRAKTGRPMLSVELEVFGDDRSPVARDGRTVGEIRARGDTVTPGYWNRPDETARAFDGDWFCTGDLATIDEEGYVEIVDRKKDMINSGGEKVYCNEVEHALYAHPAVLEAAVFGVPDDEWGESVRAAIVLRRGERADETELARFCRQRLAGFKVPRVFLFVDELPKTGTGKISKRALRERYGRIARN